jgi:hypothetical protein
MAKSEGVRNPVSKDLGRKAIVHIQQNAFDINLIESEKLKNAVKFSLQQLHNKIPGKSVELRIPPISAISIIEGKDHKRGMPPAVIEMAPITWLKIALGELAWNQAIEQGLVIASGANTDLSAYLPMRNDLVNES